MAIRKQGTKTGEVISADLHPDAESQGLQVAAGSHAWRSGDDSELGAENDAADQDSELAGDG